MAESDAVHGRVLVFTPTGRDAVMVCTALSRAQVDAKACSHIDLFCNGLSGADVAIVAEEALSDSAIQSLAEALSAQPLWSDLPIIVLGIPNSSSSVAVFERLSPVANVTLIERPSHPFTLITVTQAALRARKRQHLTRNHLAQLMEAKEEIAHQRDALAEARATLETTLNAAEIGTFTWNIPQNIIVADPNLSHMFGLSPSEAREATAHSYLQRLVPEDVAHVKARIDQAITHGDSCEVDFRIRASDQSITWLLARGRVVRSPAGSAISVPGVVLDITDRKRLEAERDQLLESERRARSEAERVGRMKDEFLSTLSHELRTPLNAIAGWAQLLQRGVLTPADQTKAVETIARNTRIQQDLIEDLLDMSRIVSGKVRLDVRPLDLPAVVAQAVDNMRPLADAKKVALLRSLDPRATPIFGDPVRVQQIIWNLVNNAVKFTGAGGRVHVVLERIGAHAQIRVSDSGAGIAAQFLPHVFDRFRQADSSSTRRHGGLGLGLAIVKQLVEMHAGTVSVTSAGESKGSTFTVTFPIAPTIAVDPAVREPAPEPPSAFESGALEGITVLLVDDDDDGRTVVARVLEESRATVLTAASVDQALDILTSRHVDILLSDIGMPERDGYDLIHTLRNASQPHLRNLPAAALTAFARDEDRQRALDAGFNCHIPKPVEAGNLLRSLKGIRSPREDNGDTR